MLTKDFNLVGPLSELTMQGGCSIRVCIKLIRVTCLDNHYELCCRFSYKEVKWFTPFACEGILHIPYRNNKLMCFEMYPPTKLLESFLLDVDQYLVSYFFNFWIAGWTSKSPVVATCDADLCTSFCLTTLTPCTLGNWQTWFCHIFSAVWEEWLYRIAYRFVSLLKVICLYMKCLNILVLNICIDRINFNLQM
jgi:hypothetical protein